MQMGKGIDRCVDAQNVIDQLPGRYGQMRRKIERMHRTGHSCGYHVLGFFGLAHADDPLSDCFSPIARRGLKRFDGSGIEGFFAAARVKA